MKSKKLCEKCGKTYEGEPALSRTTNKFICADCGIREALEAAAIPESDQTTIMQLIHDLSESKK